MSGTQSKDEVAVLKVSVPTIQPHEAHLVDLLREITKSSRAWLYSSRNAGDNWA